jgi:hypothetical protein
MGGVLRQGWERGIARGEVGRMIGRCAGARVTCACVESNEDHMVAVAAELADGFSLEVRPVMVSPAPGAAVPPGAFADADLVATTVFHADAVRAAAASAGKPCVVLRVHPGFAARVAAALHAREVTAVIADPRYAARARSYLDVTPHRGQARYVLVDELGPEVRLEAPSTLVTRAARRRLGLPEYHLVPPPPGYICPDSAGELFHAIVAVALAADASRGGMTTA